MTRAALIVGFALSLGCTPFVDTGVEGGDGARRDAGLGADVDVVRGACCIDGEVCRENVVQAVCDGFGGVFAEGETCEQSGCVPTCRTYCAEFIDVCSASAPDLARRGWCLEFCQEHSGWPAGANGDQAGNSIGCRIYHTQRALESETDEERAHHCGHAGMSGADTCGSWCENYCQMAMTICQGEDQIYEEYEDCTTACAELPDDGEIGDTVGDSVQCRIYHLGAAAESGNTATHCPHASAESADNTCVD